MSGKSVAGFGVAVVLLLAGLNVGCSNSANSSSTNPSAGASASASSSTTQPAVAADDPFHVAKPNASLEGTPAPQTTPSPEAIVTNKKVCPNCGAPNAVDATVCAKCGHKLE